MSINFMNRWSAAPWSQRHPAGAPCRSTSWPSILSQGWPVTHFRCVGVSVDERDERRMGGRCSWARSFRAHFLRVYMFSIGCLSSKSSRVWRSLRASGVIWSALVNRTGTFAQMISFQTFLITNRNTLGVMTNASKQEMVIALIISAPRGHGGILLMLSDDITRNQSTSCHVNMDPNGLERDCAALLVLWRTRPGLEMWDSPQRNSHECRTYISCVMGLSQSSA